MKIIVGLAVLFAFISLSGCATKNPQLYYWGNYSNTLYEYTKEPSARTLEAHKKELLKIVRVSGQQQKRVPPGVYAELGHLSLLEGNRQLAGEFFEKEVAIYPEAKKVVEVEIQKKAPAAK